MTHIFGSAPLRSPAVRTKLVRHGAFMADVRFGIGADLEECERSLLAAGVAVPLEHRLAWLRRGPAAHWYIAVRDGAGVCRCGVAVAVSASRSLPGHRVLRVTDFGPAHSAGARDAAVAALAAIARGEPRVLRVHLEVLARDAAVREGIARAAAACGFKRNPSPRRYAETLALDLDRDEPALLASFEGKARRNIREAAKRGFSVRPVSDPGLAERMALLLRETMQRTGGGYRDYDWNRLIEFANAHPQLSRIVGTFRPGAAGPEALVAYAWGASHGTRSEYRVSASTRLPGTRVSTTYPLVWDLITWARRGGAQWFDFGGITHGALGSADPLGGISDFKRSFCTNVETVGAEWILEPRPVRASLARALSSAAGWISTLGRRVRAT